MLRDPNTLYGQVPSALAADLDGELVALDPDIGVCYGLNIVATRVWSLLREPASLAEICRQLMLEYSVEPQECEADTSAIIEQFIDAGLARVVR